MTGIVIVAHTPLASAMLGFVEHTFGVMPEGVRAVDVPAHEDTKVSFERVLEAAKGVNAGAGILILTDVMGATPANVASKLMGLGADANFRAPVNVLAGVNLPMLMRCVSHRHEELEVLTQKALQGGEQGIARLGTQIPEAISK
ncbi:PTS system, ascorbate-specific IIA component [Polynucleobacter meluiroseus]|uniref:PTS system, ascorbate-specific IIA component n=1 Tax=Polynucleobacter meluiroseus TaxID=1938814 RepID=A0A240DX77_9BURK|nr:PTS fructose transporter subunit IIA [Polynucleobacter meluiroseus]SNX27799.1 PTS system, ascorbate-specific IIA component [Polynucleobacter meluiroseus]